MENKKFQRPKLLLESIKYLRQSYNVTPLLKMAYSINPESKLAFPIAQTSKEKSPMKKAFQHPNRILS